MTSVINNQAASNNSAIDLTKYSFYYEVDLKQMEAYQNGLKVIGKTVQGGVIKEGSKGVFAENILPENIKMMVEGEWQEVDFDAVMEDFLLENGVEGKIARRQKAADGTWTDLVDELKDYEGAIVSAQLKLDFNGKTYLNDSRVANIERGLEKARSFRVYFNDLRLGAPNVNPNTNVPTQNFYFHDYCVVLSEEFSGNRIGLARLAAKHVKATPNTRKFALQGAMVEKSAYVGAMQETKLRRAGNVSPNPVPTTTAQPSEASPNTELGRAPGAAGSGAFRRVSNLTL